MNLSRRIILTIKLVGFFATLFKIIKYPYIFFLRKVKIKKVLAHSSIKQRFAAIYHSNYWDDTHSLSGSGSNLKSTKRVIKQLPVLIKKFNINSILDAPCGDFYWMKNVLNKVNVNYLGGDIVGKIVNSNNSKYKSKKINFTKINIISDALPSAQLMICRDCLFHLSNDSIKLFLDNFLNSNIKYLLTTTHYNNADFKNTDIKDGNFRLLDLFSAPFNFDKDVLYQIDDWIDGYNPRGMILLSREQIKRRHSLN
jgi:hypothetical protein